MSFKEYQRRAVVLKGQTLDQWLSITRGFVRNANLSPTFNLLSQNLWGWGPTIHVGESPPSDSGKHEYPGRLVGGHVAILWLVVGTQLSSSPGVTTVGGKPSGPASGLLPRSLL